MGEEETTSNNEESFLASVGRIVPSAPMGATHEDDDEITSLARQRLIAQASRQFLADPGRPLLITGEAGAGKSWAIRGLRRAIAASGWTMIEADADGLVAGTPYIGMLEDRLRRFLSIVVPKRRIVWYCPDLGPLVHAGESINNTRGILDHVLAAMRGEPIALIAEAESHGWELVLQQRPNVRNEFRVLRILPTNDDESRLIVTRKLKNLKKQHGLAALPEFAPSISELAAHYLSHHAMPGRVLRLLDTVIAEHKDRDEKTPLDTSSALRALSSLTGLPGVLLDDRESLDPARLRTFFGQRIMGQPEAIDCLVERIAMLKAGLTDPSRPIGVFLFAGPTGTGKTEVVKALAEYLFGSSDRMLRIDMSELQHWGAHRRIVGQSDERGGSESLASRVRAEPFQVILLDEFEKAHASVWDLFLQVFDDARLTDANGRLADFRHCLIILTTNLGAIDHQGGGPGFTSGGASFADAQVLRAVGSAFRPEFVNRLDRIVVFRPLTRAAMRDVLRKELDRVLFRPGFRGRQWAVEWESSAIEFLLDVGFTPDMGARPLRRAVEQHVLAPLALTIAEQRYPEGDQFLFVSSDGKRIDVAFIDPDGEPDSGSRPERIASRGTATHDLRELILDSRGHQDAAAFLSQYAASMDALTEDDAWAARKQNLIARMGEADFWQAEERFEVLDALERLDRLDAMRASIDSLLTRIGSRKDRHAAGERELVGRVALNLYLLEAAWIDMKEDRPGEVLVAIRLLPAEGDPDLGPEWLGTIASMYSAWATRRLARHQPIVEAGDPAMRMLLISGAGVCRLLSPESGRHVLERTDKKTGKLRRAITCVDVMPLAAPFPAKTRARRSLITKLLGHCPEPGQASLVRRYQDGRTKLVRDAARGWRTGRLETVLGGDFDLISA